MDIRVQGAQCVFLTGEIITCRRAGVQGQSFVSVVIAPAVAAVIPGAAFGANGIAVFINHQPGQRTYSYFGHTVCRRCGKGDRKNIRGFSRIVYILCPIF